jgi:uncharacterized RDD family membrane protein YckC
VPSSGFRIVTPEAVELDLDAAGLASRFLAFLLDIIVVMVVLFAVSSVVGTIGSSAGGEVAGAVIGLFLTFGVLLVWPVAWEIGTKGQSIGKMAFGLRVVTVEGAPIKVRHALVRGLVALVEITFSLGIIAVGVALGSRRFRRLGDHLAGTVVVRERGAGADKALPRRFVPYPGWEPWAARIDATRLTADDYRLVRSYLLRSSSLPLAVRADLGWRLVRRVLPRVGLDPLLVTDPAVAQAALVAVASAYQARFVGVGGSTGVAA